jgi:hypothetical protein
MIHSEAVGHTKTICPLRPAYLICGEHYSLMGRSKGDCIEDYWHNPAETTYTLCRALPHLPADLRGRTRTYIRSEWQRCPPTLFTHVGWAQGVPREAFELPPETKDFYVAGSRAKPGNYVRSFRGWRFNPFNFYACWLFAREFGQAGQILKAIEGKVQPLPSEMLLQQRAHVLNCYIAGYTGYLNLQELAGVPRDTRVESRLAEALAMRVRHLEIHPRELDGTEAGGFLYLVPELGAHLHDKALENVRRNVRLHESMAEYWFVARTDEMTRYETRTRFQEGATSHYYEPWSLFSAKAYVLKAPRAELESYLDAPAVAVGDLYYILNLVATIEAPRP